MDIADEIASEMVEPRSTEDVRIQQGSYLLELSLDWIVLRASENVHHLLGESHVTLIEEPLGRFVHAQALHVKFERIGTLDRVRVKRDAPAE